MEILHQFAAVMVNVLLKIIILDQNVSAKKGGVALIAQMESTVI